MKLEELQHELLEALKFIDNLCKDLGVNYFIISGTLLGAVRHSGFIPWDYDADVGMLREEYDKFLVKCKNMNFENYILESAEYDCSSKISFTRLAIKNLFIKEKNTSNKYMVYIDIFPFDNTLGQKNAKERLHQFKLKLLKSLKAIRYETNVTRSKIKNTALYCMSKLFFPNIDRLSKAIIKQANKYNHCPTNYVTNYSSIYGFIRETQLKSDLKDCFLIEFEDTKLSAPKNYDRVLTNLYTDYMSIPAENKRNILDLNIYEIIREEN